MTEQDRLSQADNRGGPQIVPRGQAARCGPGVAPPSAEGGARCARQERIQASVSHL